MLESEEGEGGVSEYEERDVEGSEEREREGEGDGDGEGEIMVEKKGGFHGVFTRKITEKPGSLEDSDEEED